MHRGVTVHSTFNEDNIITQAGVSDMSSRMKAKALLAKCWDRKLPVDPEKMARDLGLTVQYDCTGGASGQIKIDETGQAEISVNPKEPVLRQRFTIAHELGHWALEHGNALFRDSPEQFRTSQRDPREVEANRFAAELLMPEEAVNAAIVDVGITDIVRLSNLFAVSQLAMKIRLEQLQWI